MRTTITLDDDVAQELRERMRKSGKSFKETVNESLRCALHSTGESAPLEPFVVRSQPLGLRSGLDYANIGDLLEQVEGPTHR